MGDKRKTMGGYAVYKGVYGYISHKTQDGTRFWFTPFGDTENDIMFTPRSDGVHRAFPGPADGPTLTYVRKSQIPESLLHDTPEKLESDESVDTLSQTR